jgi:hypothetical protein
MMKAVSSSLVEFVKFLYTNQVVITRAVPTHGHHCKLLNNGEQGNREKGSK